MKSRILILAAAFNLSSCYKNHFYVQQERIDRDFLASTIVKTPDPRQQNPPSGQQLLVSWNFPRSVFEKGLSLCLSVRFWDDTQETTRQLIQRRRDYAVFFFPSDFEGRDKRILTYRVWAVTEKGETVGEWEHPFWTKLIDVGKGGEAPHFSSSTGAE